MRAGRSASTSPIGAASLALIELKQRGSQPRSVGPD